MGGSQRSLIVASIPQKEHTSCFPRRYENLVSLLGFVFFAWDLAWGKILAID